MIGDAASKGLSAAAQALYVSGAIRMGVEFQTKMSTLIGRLNRLVNKTFTPEHFISMVYAEFTDSDNGLVSYVNAGHTYPIILHAATGQTEALGATGQIIGPFPAEKYRTRIHDHAPGGHHDALHGRHRRGVERKEGDVRRGTADPRS